MMRNLLFVLFGYLSGSVLYAHLFGRLFKKEDMLMNSKDKNPGTANAFLYGGFWCGLWTMCFDLCKGFLPIYMYITDLSAATVDLWLALVIAAPVIGHIFPIFYRFQGGKGIAVTFGCLLGLLPYEPPLLIFAAFFIFLSVGLRITPHFYRTLAAYVGTLIAMFILNVENTVCIGFLIITGAVCIRLHQSKEEREKCRVRLLWMH